MHRFLRGIEADLVAALARARRRGAARCRAAPASSRPRRGRPRKLASIGVGLRGWVSFHGFALNVTLDPADFAPIVPCGLADIEISSLARELGARRAGRSDASAPRAAVAGASRARWDAP